MDWNRIAAEAFISSSSTPYEKTKTVAYSFYLNPELAHLADAYTSHTDNIISITFGFLGGFFLLLKQLFYLSRLTLGSLLAHCWKFKSLFCDISPVIYIIDSTIRIHSRLDVWPGIKNDRISCSAACGTAHIRLHLAVLYGTIQKLSSLYIS